jgi:hypothetical protein
MFNLLTKSEAKFLRDLTLDERSKLITIGTVIADNQQSDRPDSSITFNMVVTDAVENYFKNTMQYTTDYVKQGYPSGTGLLRSISWA